MAVQNLYALWKGGFNAFAKSIDPCQPARTSQAGMGRNFSLPLILLLLIKGPFCIMIQSFVWQEWIFFLSIIGWYIDILCDIDGATWRWYQALVCYSIARGLVSVCRIEIFTENKECLLTFSQTSPAFYLSAVQVFRKHCGKRRNCS